MSQCPNSNKDEKRNNETHTGRNVVTCVIKRK